MKKAFWVVLLSLAALWSAFTQTKAVHLKTAIRTTADAIGGRLERGGKIAVVSFSSQSPDLSAYMIEEMNNALVNDGRLQVQARNRNLLEEARRELMFNDSDEVSPESAQQFGRMLGVQTIVNGSIVKIGNAYRLRIQVLEVETLTMRYTAIQTTQKLLFSPNFLR